MNKISLNLNFGFALRLIPFLSQEDLKELRLHNDEAEKCVTSSLDSYVIAPLTGIHLCAN